MKRTNKSVLLSLCSIILAGGAVSAGEAVCPLVADSTIYSYHSERKMSAGSSSKLKIKGKHETPILKFDLSGIPKGS
ncbi:MAG: hypothetical protein KAI74_04715, partial [Kiritimatiellae bacterium]|nr:hypothetical protein [Kiritimatiellia bacterium]